MRSKWMSALVGAAVLVLGCASSASAQEDDDGLPFVLESLVNGFTGGAGDSLWGWMMGGGQSAGIAAISSELQDIESTLTTIANELAEIEEQLQELQCGIDVDFINQYAGPIQSYYDVYANWLTDMQAGALPAVSDVSEWANCAVGFPTAGQTCAIAGGVDLLTLMNELNDAATATAGAGGSISDCIKTKGAAPAAGTLDDRPYYTANVVPITNWYLGTQTQALIVLTEAYHFRAWQAEGSPTSSDAADIYDNVCPMGATPDGCIEPITIYNNDFAGFAKGELEAGGAPYSTGAAQAPYDGFLMINGTNVLLPTSLEAYTLAPGGGGSSDSDSDCFVDPPGHPLETTDPCGITAGHFNASLESIAYGPYGYGAGGYGTWEAASADVFKGLLDQGFNGNGSNCTNGLCYAQDFLCTLSLDGPADPSAPVCNQANGGVGLYAYDKIVVFNQTGTALTGTALIPTTAFTAMVFLDGRVGAKFAPMPFGLFREFFNAWGDWLFQGTQCSAASPNDRWAQRSAFDVNGAQGSNPNWYQAFYDDCSITNPNTQWRPLPQWAVENTVPMFRWPALDWTKLTCSDASAPADAVNPAGVPTLCGKDFDSWFDTQVPPGPAQMATADTTLDRVHRNLNDGRGRLLTLAAGSARPGDKRVAVEFDQEQVRAFLDAGPLASARLVLISADHSRRGGGHWVTALPLGAPFVEGNGDAAAGDRGTGSGATWNCAEDADISDDAEECLQDWWGPLVRGRGAVAVQKDGYAGPVSWDVTEHVAHGVTAWLLVQRHGRGRSLAYHSREGAAALGDPSQAPILLLSRGTEEDAVVATAHDGAPAN